MCRSLGCEIYDLAWSPDAVFFIIGSMDNIARIYNAQTGIDSRSSHLASDTDRLPKGKWSVRSQSTTTTSKV